MFIITIFYFTIYLFCIINSLINISINKRNVALGVDATIELHSKKTAFYMIYIPKIFFIKMVNWLINFKITTNHTSLSTKFLGIFFCVLCDLCHTIVLNFFF